MARGDLCQIAGRELATSSRPHHRCDCRQSPVIRKRGIRLVFWSGADFDEAELGAVGKKFRDASVFCDDVSEIGERDLLRWLEKSKTFHWD